MVGRNDILTAAHVVYSPTLETVDIDIDYSRPNDPVTGLTVIGEGFNGVNIANLEEGEAINWRVNSWAAPVEDGQLSKAGSEWDLALIGVSDPIGDTTGWANILPNQGSGTYTAAGFASLQLTADTGHVNFSPPYDIFNPRGLGPGAAYDITDLFTDKGSSGGPLLNADHEVVGVISTRGNLEFAVGDTERAWANRIDGEWDTLNQWMSDNNSLLTSPSLHLDPWVEIA